MNAAGDRVSLEVFLDPLPPAEAAAAREAAAEIDRLAAIGNAMEGFERRLLPFAIVGLAMFLVGLWFLLWPGYSAGWWLAALLGALPLVVAIYAVRIAPRTRADNRADALNREHFLPHGGVYLPPGDEPAAVLRIKWAPSEASSAELPRDRGPAGKPAREAPGSRWG